MKDRLLNSGELTRRGGWPLRGLLVALCVALVAAEASPLPTYVAAEEAGTAKDAAADETLEEPAASESRSSPAAESSGSRTLLDTLKDGGTVGAVIILLSMIGVGFMVEHALTIRKTVLMPDHVVQELDELIGQGQIDQAIEACCTAENQSLFSHVVLAGLERYKSSEFGFAEYKAAVEEAGEEQTARLYRKTEVLGVIGQIAPMLGLLGTVTGMIRAFNVISATGGFARPDQLASGISEALVTTVEGLVVAIPTMCAFSFFRNRIDSLVAEAGKRVEQVLIPLGRRRA